MKVINVLGCCGNNLVLKAQLILSWLFLGSAEANESQPGVSPRGSNEQRPISHKLCPGWSRLEQTGLELASAAMSALLSQSALLTALAPVETLIFNHP